MIETNQKITEYLNIIPADTLKTALDLGCGKGRISLLLIKKGIKVTGVDIKDFNLKEEGFDFLKSDIRDFNFTKSYDLIISSLILHFIRKDKAIEILKNIKQNTSDKGFNLLVCMSNLDDCSKSKPDNFYPSLEELKEIYLDWDIIKFEQDCTDIEQHDNSEPHKHNLIFLLAKKRQ